MKETSEANRCFACADAGEKGGAQRGRRFICPRHMDYWRQVYGCSSDRKAPGFLEFGCYETDTENPYLRDEFYHFEMGNIDGANAVFRELDENNEWNDSLKRADFKKQLKRLEDKKIEYFIGCLYYPQAPRFQGIAGQLPQGKTLFDCVNASGIPADYAVLYVAEIAPLTPDVLCAWMEKLSPALFGDGCEYRIPHAAIPDPKEVNERMAGF